MNLSKGQKNSIVFFVIGLLIMFLFFVFFIPKKDKSIINLISVTGTYLSTFGLIVAYIQISSVKKITEITNKEVQNTRERINQFISITHIAKGIKLADEVQQYLKSRKYESAHLRLKDLKVIVLGCETIHELKLSTNDKKFKKLKSNLFVDIDNLSNYNGNDGRELNFQVINSNIEHIVTTFIEFENLLKLNNL